MNRRSLNWTLIALAAAAAIGVAWWVNTQHNRLPDGIHRGNGRLEVERIEVAAKYPGRIIELPVHEGDLVKAGDVIARQDPTDLLAQRGAVEAARDRAGQAMQRAGAETEVRMVQARIAQLELDHATRLKQDALISGAEVERRTAQRDGERAGIQVARAAIGEATAARAEAQAQIERINVALDDLVLRAGCWPWPTDTAASWWAATPRKDRSISASRCLGRCPQARPCCAAARGLATTSMSAARWAMPGWRWRHCKGTSPCPPMCWPPPACAWNNPHPAWHWARRCAAWPAVPWM